MKFEETFKSVTFLLLLFHDTELCCPYLEQVDMTSLNGSLVYVIEDCEGGGRLVLGISEDEELDPKVPHLIRLATANSTRGSHFFNLRNIHGVHVSLTNWNATAESTSFQRVSASTIKNPVCYLNEEVDWNVTYLRHVQDDVYESHDLSNDWPCLAQWKPWAACNEGNKFRSRDCFIRNGSCLFFPEEESVVCSHLGLSFPANNTIYAIPGEELQVILLPDASDFPIFFRFSETGNLGPNSSSLSTTGTFKWTLPEESEQSSHDFVIEMYNTKDDFLQITITVENPICACTGYGVCGPAADWVPGVGPFDCVCDKGRTGNFCEVDVDECESSPCYQGVDCINLPGAYWCDGCSNDMTGDGVHCEPMDDNSVFTSGDDVDDHVNSKPDETAPDDDVTSAQEPDHCVCP